MKSDEAGVRPTPDTSARGSRTAEPPLCQNPKCHHEQDLHWNGETNCIYAGCPCKRFIVK